ncbi:MAG: sulfate ABC transporter substrate-binding protein [Acidobacteria bacterium]|nr:sulfate ABC transporter substrate-binding protein [Acidobacteriota bacterium]MBU1474818.1 sulfate ABC transporter substrate-binding protein [Acidobacteriota bacterium]MBU2437653.1 sulfate ABC transporter substrate-binding protein [Acidobacteriota bacterium]
MEVVMLKKICILLIPCMVFAGCSKGTSTRQDEIILTLGAYTVPREVYEKVLIPEFTELWLKKTGQTVKFHESYIASGAQSRAIEQGFEADIASLSLEKDMDRLKDAGLILHDWKSGVTQGFVTRSVVAIAFRSGNPKNISDWEDLTKEGVNVLYPSPKTSGGAMWDVAAIYGAGLRMSEDRTGLADPDFAKNLLKSIQKNVRVMDKSGRASVTTFENGIGDALVTYENEILLRRLQGRDLPYVIPEATILIENPIAVIDAHVDKHGTREVAQAFVEYLLTDVAQRAFARYGFRPVIETVAEEFKDQYPRPRLLFDIQYLGGWDRVHQTIFGPAGVWTVVMDEVGREF